MFLRCWRAFRPLHRQQDSKGSEQPCAGCYEGLGHLLEAGNDKMIKPMMGAAPMLPIMRGAREGGPREGQVRGPMPRLAGLGQKGGTVGEVAITIRYGGSGVCHLSFCVRHFEGRAWFPQGIRHKQILSLTDERYEPVIHRREQASLQLC